MSKNILKKEDILSSPRPFRIEPIIINNSVPNTSNHIQAFVDSNLLGGGGSDLLSGDISLAETKLKRLKEEAQDVQLSLEAKKKATLESLDKEVDSRRQESEQMKEKIILESEKEAKEIIEEANETANKIKNEASLEKQKIHEDAKQEGFETGYNQSLERVEGETKRLVTLLQTITSGILDEKNKLLTSIESDLVDLTLLIASKVVKSITENYKQVVYDNVIAAINKLKFKSDIIIKVNPSDLPTMEQYKANILKDIQDIENIQFIEDPSVDIGGCIIRSDFGSVDARISSQFAEIEEQIRRISPIKDI